MAAALGGVAGGTVTSVGTSGAGITGGPITTTGTLAVQWNAGAVSALGAGLSLTTGTLAATPSFVVTQSWIGINPNNVVIHEFLNAGTVDLVYGNVEVLNGSAFTVVVVKASSGTAIASGVTVASTFNANTLPFTNQTLTLSGTPANLVGAVGDRLGLITTGTAAATMVANIAVRIHP